MKKKKLLYIKGAFGMPRGMTMGMSLIVVVGPSTMKESIPPSLAIYGIWKICDFHSHSGGPNSPKQTLAMTIKVIVSFP